MCKYSHYVRIDGYTQKKALRQIAPESSPEGSAKSLSHHFLVVPLLSLKRKWVYTLGPERRGYTIASRLSGGATEPSQPDLPLWTRLPPDLIELGPDFAQILTRFGPEVHLFGSESGQNQVKIGSGSGLEGGVQRRSGSEGSLAPPESLDHSCFRPQLRNNWVAAMVV